MPFLTSLSNSSSGGVSAATPAKLSTVNDISNPSEAVDYYGSSGSISISYFAVGAPRHTSGIYTDTGIAYLYRKIDGELLHTFNDPDPNVNYPSKFGTAVAVTEEYVAIGATETSVGGTVYIYDVNTYENVRILFNPNYNSGDTTPIGDKFGNKIEIVGDYIIVSAPTDDISASETSAGIVYIFNILTGDSIKTIINPAAVRTGGEFGYDIDVFENNLIIGSPYANSNSGAAYIYQTQSGNWSDTTLVRTLDNLSDTANTNNSYFGTSVAIEGDLCVVGARDAGNYAGKVYVYNVINGSLAYSLTNPNTLSPTSRYFGFKVALSDEVLAVHAFGYVGTYEFAGCVFIYERTGGELLESLNSDSTLSNDTRYAADTLEISGQYILISEKSSSASDSAKVIVYNYVPAKLAGANLPVNYTLAATQQPVPEGQSFTVYLSTRNVPVGTSVPYTISGISAIDIGRTSVKGTFIISEDQTATTVVDISTDSIVEGTEIFTLKIDNTTESISVSITDTTENIGEALFVDGGIYYWKCPPGVTTVSVVCIGAGGNGNGAGGINTRRSGAGGGGLTWANNVTVVPNTYYRVVVGAGGISPSVWSWYSGMVLEEGDGPEVSDYYSRHSSFNNLTVYAGGGQEASNSPTFGGANLGYVSGVIISPNINQGGGKGGNGRYSGDAVAGGGGAGGYGDGNNFGHGSEAPTSPAVPRETLFDGAGAGGGYQTNGGGGSGPYGIQMYPSVDTYYNGGTSNGQPWPSSGWRYGFPYYGQTNGTSFKRNGGSFGGGGAGGGYGGAGCVRIMWGGGRSFPFNAGPLDNNNYATRLRESYYDDINKLSTTTLPASRRYGEVISSRDDKFIVGCSEDDLVTVHRFDYQSGNYPARKTFWERPTVEGTNPYGSNENFGKSVDTDGIRVIVGAPAFNYLEPSNTKVSVGRFFVGSISNTSVVYRYVSTPPGFPVGNERYGSAVAIEGQCAAVAAHGDVDGEKGAVYIYRSDSTSWNGNVSYIKVNRPSDLASGKIFGFSLAMDGNYLAVGTDGGKVYIYEISQLNTNHTLIHTIETPYTSGEMALELTGNILGIGAYSYNTVYLYNVVTGELLSELVNPNINNDSGDSFGRSISISSQYIVVGSPYDDSELTNSGSAYIYDISTYQLVTSLTNPLSSYLINGYFGYGVATSGFSVVVTRPNKDANAIAGANWFLYDVYQPN
jgi:hypothetical protein